MPRTAHGVDEADFFRPSELQDLGMSGCSPAAAGGVT
jgi:hypothetical protein